MKPETRDQLVPHRPRGAHPRRRLSTLLGLASAAALTVGLSACGGGTTAATTKPAANVKPAAGGTIYYAHDLEVPCLQGGWVEEAYIERQYTDSLVSQTSGGHIVPWLATSWSASKSQLTWTFHLKPGVNFSDGTPLNAQAVVDNFNYWTNPKAGNADVSSYIGPYFKSAKAINNLTVQVNLRAPYSPLLSSLSQGYDGILSPTGLKRGTDANCVDPIGSGPFIIQKWNHGQNIVFVRNPHYNSAPANAVHQGPAHVSRLVWGFVANPTTRWASLTTGQSNVIEDVPTVDWQTAKSQFDVAEYVTPGRPQTLSLNTDLGPFTDVRLRQAFAYAVNRRAAVQSAFNGEIPFDGNGALSPSTPGYDAALNDSFPYAPAKAAALLNQAGWSGRNAAGYRTKSGKELDITLVYGLGSIVNDEGATLLQDLQQEWKAAGFNVKLVPATLSQLFAGTYDTPKGYDATIGYWTSPTPAVLYITYLPWNAPGHPNYSNSTFYDNAQLVKTIADANSSLDPTVQNADYTNAQQTIVNQAVAVGLYTKTTTLAWSKQLHGLWIENSQGEPVFSDAYFAK